MIFYFVNVLVMLWLLCSFVACVSHFYLPCTSCGRVPPIAAFFVYRVYHHHYYWFWQISLCLEKKIHTILPKDFHIGRCYLFHALPSKRYIRSFQGTFILGGVTFFTPFTMYIQYLTGTTRWVCRLRR